MSLVHEVQIDPAWDKRHPDPKQNYGVHGVEMRFVVRDEPTTLAIVFTLYTNWQLPHVWAEQQTKPRGYEGNPHVLCRPMPADIGYHRSWRLPQGYCYEDDCSRGDSCEHSTALEDWSRSTCQYMDQQPCVYDGSSLGAHSFFDTLVAEGTEKLWLRMEQYWIEEYSGKPAEAHDGTLPPV